MELNNEGKCENDSSLKMAAQEVKEKSPKPRKKAPGEKRTSRDFYFGKQIGDGSFSSVYLAKDRHTNQEYAIKTCDKEHIRRFKKRESIIREKKVMNILNDNQNKTAPFFVKLCYAFYCEINLYFVMTYCKNGELLKYIKKVNGFDKKSASFYTAEIVLALEHLHSLNIVHRDLKPENILLDENMHIKLTDFGSAVILNDPDEDAMKNNFDGTAQYVSPEVLQAAPISGSADLWALGCVIFQILSGFPPFNSPSEYLIFQMIQKLDYTFPNGFEESAKDLVSKLLVLDSGERLGAKDSNGYSSIRQHPFLSDLEFHTLYLQTPPTILGYIPDLDSENKANEQLWTDDYSPGLNVEAFQRMVFCDSSPPQAVARKNKGIEGLLSLSAEEEQVELAEQQRINPYHEFVEGNLVLKQGLLDKRKGFFPRRRMFLLTKGPRLYYVDPVNKVLKGEVPWSETLLPDPKDFKNFHVHTPNRSYILTDPDGNSNEWCNALDIVRSHYFSKQS